MAVSSRAFIFLDAAMSSDESFKTIVSSCRSVRDFPDYVGLLTFVNHFQGLEIHAPMLSAAEASVSTYQDDRTWSNTIASDPQYLPVVIVLSLLTHAAPLNHAVPAVTEFELIRAGLLNINELGAHDILVKDGFMDCEKMDTALAEMSASGLEQRNGLSGPNVKILLEACRVMTASLDWSGFVDPMVRKCGNSTQHPPLAEGLLIASLLGFWPKDRVLQIHCCSDHAWFLATLMHVVLGRNVCVAPRSGSKDTVRFGGAPEHVAIQTTEGKSGVKVSLRSSG